MYLPENFVHRYPPQRVHFGVGLARRLAPLLEGLGLSRCLLLCGEHVGAGGWPEELVAGAQGRIIAVHRGVRPHAPTATVDAAADVARELRVDSLISLGGGSAHDTARAVALCLCTGRRMTEHFATGQTFVHNPPATVPGPTLVAIPSTFSAAETTCGGGVVDGPRKLVFLADTLYIPEIVLDPDVFATTPPKTLLASGMNALNHALERLLSPRHQPLADAQFLHALRLLVPGLRRLAQVGVVDRATLAGCILGAHLSDSTNVLGGIGHAIAHVLGGRYRVSHGVANAVVMPAAIGDAARERPEKVGLVAEVLGLPASAHAIERFLNEYVAKLGLPHRLAQIGVPRADLAAIAADTLADISASASARSFTRRSVEALLARAY
jgi:alcohol dehydrogenase class IV